MFSPLTPGMCGGGSQGYRGQRELNSLVVPFLSNDDEGAARE